METHPKLKLGQSLRRMSRLIFGSLLVYAWVAPAASAQEPGLSYETYASQGSSPALPDPTQQPLSSGIVSAISFDWGGGEVLDSGRYDQVLVRFDGWLSPPTTDTFYLCGLVDDGFQLFLDGLLVINDWWDKPPMCGQTADVDFSDGQPKQLTAWMYENGGGAAAILLYYTGDGWAPIPAEWYSTSPPTPTTTTTEPTTTTTEVDTTTSEVTTSTEVQESSTTTIDTEPETTTVPVETTWAESTNPTTTPSTGAPVPNVPVTTENAPTTASPTSSEPSTTMNSQPETSSPQSSEPSTTSASETSTVETAAPSEPTLSPVEPPLEPSVPEAPSGPTEPTDGNLEATTTTVRSSSLVETIPVPPNDASDEQKHEFEAEVNVFDGSFDDYIPAGSNVTVAQRRTIIAVTAATTLLAPVTSQRRKG